MKKLITIIVLTLALSATAGEMPKDELLKTMYPVLKDVTILTKQSRIIYKDKVIISQSDGNSNTVTFVPKGVEYREFNTVEEKSLFVKDLKLKTVEEIENADAEADAKVEEVSKFEG